MKFLLPHLSAGQKGARRLYRKRQRIYKRDGYKCLACGNTEDLTLDHIVSVSKGGSNRDLNLQTLCGYCNCEKGDDIVSYRKELPKPIDKFINESIKKHPNNQIFFKKPEHKVYFMEAKRALCINS